MVNAEARKCLRPVQHTVTNITKRHTFGLADIDDVTENAHCVEGFIERGGAK